MAAAAPLSTAETTASGPVMTDDIERLDWSALGPEHYHRAYMMGLKPVVITGALDHWPARTKWTPEFFREKYPDLRVHIRGGGTWLLGPLVDAVLASTPEKPAPYLHEQNADEDWPAALTADISPLPQCTRPNWLESKFFPSRSPLRSTEFFLGGVGAKFPYLHYDLWHLHAFLMQVYGVKEYVAFAPDQSPYMYAKTGENDNISQVNSIENPDFERFPLFRKARGLRFKLYPGETLYMPAGWWHTAKILSTSITISVNGANAANWRAFRHDRLRAWGQRSRVLSTAMGAYLSLFEGLMRAQRN